MDDIELLKQLNAGDKKAYKQLFIKYYSPLVEYACQYVPDEDAEELVQELMIYIWENRKNLVIGVSLKAYLFTAVKFRCLNAIRLHQFHQRVHGLIYEEIKDMFEDPDFYLANELEENIRKAIDELPETYRETFILSRLGGRTNVQVAQELDVSVKTVEYRIKHALEILRVKLKDYMSLLMWVGF